MSIVSVFCSDKSGVNNYQFPKVIAGQVKNTSGLPLENAKVSLPTASNVEPVFTNAQGYFRIENVPEGKHKIRVELYGYEIYEADVPSAINGISTINPILTKKDYITPSIKPVSKGPVRIYNNKLQVDFDGDGNYSDFFIKGVAYSPTPIGNRPVNVQQEERSLQYLKNLNANTIRTYSGANPEFLKKLAANGIYCILGFWVDYNVDLSIPSNREKIKSDWIKFVLQFKDNPGLLMWNIGNEQNYQNGNNAYWYSLCQELATIAYNIEGEKYHPVAINNGEIFNIGDASKFKKYLEQQGITVDQDVITSSLFDNIKMEKSKINILIGSKKFIEGWDTWRVSSMGLLNIGKGQGPQIIQLFGRGVRLKGKNMSLKRSDDKFVKPLETLNIFGIKADYLNKFLDAISKEEVEFETIEIPDFTLTSK